MTHATTDTKPTVSIIMPAHNSEGFLQDAVHSVIAQTFEHWELILIDDASTDATADIAADLRQIDPRIVVQTHSQNGGAAVSRNTGLEIAQGRYVAFLDADDVWAPDKLDIQLKWMRDTQSRFSCTSYTRVNTLTSRSTVISAKDTVTRKALLSGNTIGCSTVIYDRKGLEHKRFPLLRLRQDFAMWLLLLSDVEICHGINQPLTTYRHHGKNSSAGLLDRIFWTWKMYREHAHLSRISSLSHLARHLLNASKRNFLRA